jgi:hypothetical protein
MLTLDFSFLCDYDVDLLSPLSECMDRSFMDGLKDGMALMFDYSTSWNGVCALLARL